MKGGHGHLIPNESGDVARCGGPALCGICEAEQQQLCTDYQRALEPLKTEPPIPLDEIEKAQRWATLERDGVGASRGARMGSQAAARANLQQHMSHERVLRWCEALSYWQEVAHIRSGIIKDQSAQLDRLRTLLKDAGEQP